MKSSIVLALALSANAFAPALRRTTSALRATNGWTPDESKPAYGLPGALAPVGFFDPAGFSEGKTVNEVKMLREAEVTHGRVSMLAVIGFLVQERFHPLFEQAQRDIGPAIRHLDEVRAVSPIFFDILAFTIALAELYRSQYGWVNPKAPGSVAPLGNLPEGALRALNDNYYPGDIGFDPLGLKPEDAVEFETMATKELQHGRLAMLAVAGFLAQELVDGHELLDGSHIFGL
jgi:hypothetical protein